MASQLQHAGQEVSFLGVFDTDPASDASAPAEPRRAMMEAFAAEAALPLAPEWSGMSDEARLDMLLDQAIQGGLVPQGFGRADAERQYRMQLGHQSAAWSYRLPRLAIPLTVFAATGEKPGRAEMLRHAWQPFARNGLHVVEITGTHLHLMRQPAVGELGRSLADCLDRIA